MCVQATNVFVFHISVVMLFVCMGGGHNIIHICLFAFMTAFLLWVPVSAPHSAHLVCPRRRWSPCAFLGCLGWRIVCEPDRPCRGIQLFNGCGGIRPDDVCCIARRYKHLQGLLRTVRCGRDPFCIRHELHRSFDALQVSEPPQRPRYGVAVDGGTSLYSRPYTSIFVLLPRLVRRSACCCSEGHVTM